MKQTYTSLSQHLNSLPTNTCGWNIPDLDIGVGDRGLPLGALVGKVGNTSVDGFLLFCWLLLAPDLNHDGTLLHVVQRLANTNRGHHQKHQKCWKPAVDLHNAWWCQAGHVNQHHWGTNCMWTWRNWVGQPLSCTQLPCPSRNWWWRWSKVAFHPFLDDYLFCILYMYICTLFATPAQV